MIQIVLTEEGRMQTTTAHLKRGIREGNLHHSKSQCELSADPRAMTVTSIGIKSFFQA